MELRPIEGSSSNSTLGWLIRARAMASICCSHRHGSSQLILALLQSRKDAKHPLNIRLNTRFVIARVSPHEQVLGNGHACKYTAPLRNHDQISAASPRLPALDAFTLVEDVAITHRQAARDCLHRRGLACTVGANQRDQLPSRTTKSTPNFDGLNSAVALSSPLTSNEILPWPCYLQGCSCTCSCIFGICAPDRPQSLFHSSAPRLAYLRQWACRNPAP